MSRRFLKVLIVEDEVSLQLDLEMLLNDLHCDIVGTTDNSEEAIKMVYTQQPDIIFMDIDINGHMSGIDVGKVIADTKIPIVYITSNDNQELYSKAKEETPLFFYMLKPVNALMLESVLNLIDKQNMVQLTQSQNKLSIQDMLLVKHHNIYHKVKLCDIQYIATEDVTSVIYTNDKKFVTYKKLIEIEKVLPKDKFYRTYRSHLINIDYFVSINIYESTIKMQNGANVPVSRNNKRILLDMLNVT